MRRQWSGWALYDLALPEMKNVVCTVFFGVALHRVVDVCGTRNGSADKLWQNSPTPPTTCVFPFFTAVPRAAVLFAAELPYQKQQIKSGTVFLARNVSSVLDNPPTAPVVIQDYSPLTPPVLWPHFSDHKVLEQRTRCV